MAFLMLLIVVFLFSSSICDGIRLIQCSCCIAGPRCTSEDDAIALPPIYENIDNCNSWGSRICHDTYPKTCPINQITYMKIQCKVLTISTSTTDVIPPDNGTTCNCFCCKIGPSCMSSLQAIPQPPIPVTSCDSCSASACRVKYPSTCPSDGTNNLVMAQCESSSSSSKTTTAAAIVMSTAFAPPLSNTQSATCNCSCCIGCASSTEAIVQPSFSVPTCDSNSCSQNVCASKYPYACPKPNDSGISLFKCVSSSAEALSFVISTLLHLFVTVIITLEVLRCK